MAGGRIEEIIGRLSLSTKTDLSTRVARVRANAVLIVQAAVAAALAFGLASRLPGHPTPFFAPIAAVVTVAMSMGQRLRRSFELVLGNAVGILLADVLIWQIGTGAWQVGLVVLCALVTSMLIGGGAVILIQSSSAAILIATLTPPTAEALWNVNRFVDALVGGGIGLLVVAVLIPTNPLRLASRATAPILVELEAGYRAVALALQGADVDAADEALRRARRTQPLIDNLSAGLQAGEEAARAAPVRWGARGQLSGYLAAAPHLDNATRNLRTLARHAHVLLDRGESAGQGISASVLSLADALGALRPVLEGRCTPDQVRRHALEAVELASGSLAGTGDVFGQSLVADVRMAAADLLMASGSTSAEAASAVRAVAGE